MKKLLLTATLALGMASYASAASRTVEYPIIGYASGKILDVAKVELNDSVTIVDLNAYYYPKHWIKIVGGSYLTNDGKRYALKSTEGITPDELFWMPESGQASFRLIFEPLPLDTRSFDLIEGDVEGAFKLADILIPTTPELPERYPAGVPEEVKAEFIDMEMPAPVFESANTTVRFHLISSKPEYAENLRFVAESMFGYVYGTELKFDDNGIATFTFHQDGTVNGKVIDGSTYIPYAYITLNPGETVDCYIDGRLSGVEAMYRRKNVPVMSYSKTMHTGALRNLDKIKSPGEAPGNKTDYHEYLMNYMNTPFYNLDNEQFMKFLKDTYDNCRDSISRSDAPAMVKEYQLLCVQNGIANALNPALLEYNYRISNDYWDGDVPRDSIRVNINGDIRKELTGWIDLSNPKMLLAGDALSQYPDWNTFGVPGDLSKSCVMLKVALRKATAGDLTQEDLDELKTLSNPFFYNVADSVSKDVKRKLEEAKTPDNFRATPEVADDEVFDAIIAQHKGKVVVVDLWNTWCGPCRAAIKQTEPIKAGELASDDIVWIYIADKSSDPLEYLKMIPDIKGIHYKLNQSQIEAINQRFSVDGIPFYILVDRDGNAKGRPDIRDHSKYVKEIKALL